MHKGVTLSSGSTVCCTATVPQDAKMCTMLKRKGMGGDLIRNLGKGNKRRLRRNAAAYSRYIPTSKLTFRQLC